MAVIQHTHVRMSRTPLLKTGIELRCKDGKRVKDSVASQDTPADDAAPIAHTQDALTQHLIEQLLNIARVSALEEMASGIAHELNQPLGAIATFSQAGERMLARPTPMLKETVEVLQSIGNEALNAGEGIRRIRRLFHRADPARSACSMPELIAELQPVLELLAARTGARLEIDAASVLPRVMVDRLRIQHVLFTLVQNALDASPPDSRQQAVVRIEVSADKYLLETAVIDQGIGIEATAQQQLFRPFFTTKAKGTGLGLASSRAIIEAHEGTIGFENGKESGARFWFRLPALN